MQHQHSYWETACKVDVWPYSLLSCIVASEKLSGVGTQDLNRKDCRGVRLVENTSETRGKGTIKLEYKCVKINKLAVYMKGLN